MKMALPRPASSSEQFVNILAGESGLKPDAVSIIGIGAGAGAVGHHEAPGARRVVEPRPRDSQLESDGSTVPVIDTRTERGCSSVYGDAYRG